MNNNMVIAFTLNKKKITIGRTYVIHRSFAIQVEHECNRYDDIVSDVRQ